MKLTITHRFTPAELAAGFCDLDDDQQAQFFIEVARIAATWDGTCDQWYNVGKHLRECACATEESRDIVRRIAEGVGL